MSKKRNASLAEHLVQIDNRRLYDRDHTAAALESTFSDVVLLEHAATPDNHYYEQSVVTFGRICLARFAGSGGKMIATLNRGISLGWVIKGSAEMTIRGRAVSNMPFANANLMGHGTRFTVALAPHTVAQVLDIDGETLATQARAMFDQEFRSDSLATEVSLIGPAGAMLARSTASVLNEIQLLAAASLSDLAIASFSELIGNLVLATILAPLPTAAADVSAPVVSRARDYLAAHAHEPIRIFELAQHLGVSTRALQIGFKKTYGRTPLQYLIECRLENARVRLLSAEAPDTVTSIAWECGFMQPSVFSARYRARFGELPSQTLKRSR
jgi:AraC-like DNA-binding protein